MIIVKFYVTIKNQLLTHKTMETIMQINTETGEILKEHKAKSAKAG